VSAYYKTKQAEHALDLAQGLLQGSQHHSEILKAYKDMRAVNEKEEELRVEYSQFLSDVLTAAGLVSYGRQCKALGERLSEGTNKFRKS
jgi:hypothetical protein